MTYLKGFGLKQLTM